MRPHYHGDEKVARRAAVHTGVALAALGYGLPVVYTGGDGDLYLVLAAYRAHAAAGLARLMDDLARALALGARRVGLHHAEGSALRRAHGARALAVGADLGRRAGLAARALAVGAGLHAADCHFLLAAEGRLLKAYADAGAYVVAPARGVGIGALAAPAEAEYVAEAAEYVAQIAEAVKAEAAAPAEPGVRVECRVAELIVFLTLILVGKHLIGLVDLLEALLAGLVARMQVGMILLCKLSVCLFYLIGARVL